MRSLMRSTVPLNGTISVTGTPVLRGATVDARVVVFNQVHSPKPGTTGTIDRKAVVKYHGTDTIAVRGGVHIWSKSEGAKVSEGYDVQVEVGPDSALHLILPPGFQPRISGPMPRDNVATTCTPLSAPVAPTVRDSEFALT
jgi:hypothetical protein